MKEMNMPIFSMENTNPLFILLFLNFMGRDLTRATLEHPNLKKLLASDEQFDAVIIEEFLVDSVKAVAHHYKAPLILFSTVGSTPWVNAVTGNPAPPSYIPQLLLNYSSRMTFWQRLYNFIFTFLMNLDYDFILLPAQDRIIREHFPDAPHVTQLNQNASIILLNSHESTNQPVPLVPNMIPIGGFHIKPSKTLPDDLKAFMDNAKEGVVYFSMGSNIKPSEMPDNIKEAILKAFGRIKQKVLWKWDEDTLLGKPDNVKLSKWLPQQEILAHPNTRLFITHGGLLSVTETIYQGVPILSFPIFADQKANAARAELNGIGLTLPFSQITEEKLKNALDILLNDSKYRNAAKTRSSYLRDRPIKPLDLAIYWIEFVIRHGGASHLRVAAVDLPWYKYHLLDVIAFIGLIIISSVAIIYVLIRRLCFSNKVSKIKIKKN